MKRYGLAFLLIGWAAAKVASETIDVDARYPSPAGIYRQFISTFNTWLARDGGNAGVGVSAFQPPAPNGKAGNLYVANDIYLGATKQWLSSSQSPNFQVFTSGGVFAVPPGVAKILVEAWGGGGGGGSSPTGHIAGGGGAGGYGKGVFSVTPKAAYAVSVGAGGAAGGGNGGNSSFGSFITAYGGMGGRSQSATTIWANGGAGGTSNGSISVAGAAGQYGSNYQGAGGAAGGGGGAGGTLDVIAGGSNTAGPPPNGRDGRAPGGGGAGGNLGNPPGSGAPGRVIVWW